MRGSERAIKRWWSDGDNLEWVDADGFSYGDEWFARYSRGGRFALDSLSDVACVVLLGEGGSGKSTEMRRWFDASKESGRSIWVDGRCLSSGRAPLSELRQKSDFDKWVRRNESLTLWIDGVDEAPCTPLELLQSLRHELSGYSEQLPLLRLRLACRSTAWSRECDGELRLLLQAAELWKVTDPLVRRDKISPTANVTGGERNLSWSARRPLRELRDASEFADWAKGSGGLTLWIDGLDQPEDKLLELLQSLRRELSGFSKQLPRLRVRIACRRTAWSQECDAALWPLYFRRIRLRPLARDDVKQFIEGCGVVNASDEFDRLIARDLGPLLSRPQLLEEVVEAIRAGDELTVLSLRRRGVRRQLVRANQRVESSLIDQRRVAAQWVAALSVLHRMSLDAVLRRADELETSGRLVRPSGPQVIDVRADTIRALFEESQLFDRSGALGWAHQSWAEFLCAEWISSLDRTADEKCALVAAADGAMDVLPETIDAVAGYLAMLDPAMAGVLIERAPLAMLRSDSVAFDDRLRCAVLDGVIALARRSPSRVLQWGIGPMLRRFINESCDERLANALLDRSAPEAVRWVGLRGNERTPKQLEAALCVSLDREELTSLRAAAAEHVALYGRDDLRERLRPLLDERESDEGRLTVAALDALWRRERGGQSLLPFTELLAVLVRLGSPRLISGFRIRLLSTLEDDELAKLLVAVAPRTRNELMFGTHEVVHEILSRGLDAFWIERLLDVVLGDDPTAGAVVRQDIEHEVTAIAQREELAQHVLLNATVRDPKQQRRARWVLSRWVHSVSLPWLLARCSDREQDALWCGWACDRFGAIVNSGDVARMSEALELMGEARERVLLLRESTRLWFEGMSVDDVSESDRDLARGEEQLRRDQAARADARDQQRSRWLERVGEPEAFWRLVVSAVRGEDVERALRGDNIASGAWWVALTPAQQTAVLDGAERYLNTGGPHEETWYLQSRLDYRALAGRLAMELLLASGRRLDPAICERWSYVLFEEWGGVDRGSLRDQLIQWAAHVAPRAVNERAIELTEHAIEQGQWVFVTRVYAGIRLDQLLDALPKLMAKVTTPSSVPDLFGYWLRWRPELAAQFAEGTLRDVTPQTALHVGLSAALIANPSDRLWSIAADAFARASSLLDAVLAAELPLESSRSDREAFESVSTRLLARMWSVWANSRAAQQPEGVIELVASGRLLFDRMLTVLFDRASRSAEDLAVFEQLASSPHAPEWMASRVEDARLELRARSWTARPLDTLRAAMRPVAAGVAGALHGASVVIRSATADVGASMKRLFTWVHLSDIHFGHGARDALVEFDQAEVTAKLPKHIHKELKRTGLSIDAVLVTGDVAFSGQAKEYQQAHEWFDLLCTSAGIAKERVFVVPGNHDVNAVGDDFATGALVEQLRKSEPESRHSLAEAWKDDGAMSTLVKRQSAFWEFADRYAPVKRQGQPFKGWWTYELAVEGTQVQIIGANTALISAKLDRQGDIAFGEGQRKEVALATKGDLVLLMTHHPFSGGWLRDEQNLSTRLSAKAVLHLCGHIHQANARSTRDAAGFVVNVIEAGAVHKEKRVTTHEYSICSLIERDGSRWLQQWPYEWVDARGDFDWNKSRLPQSAPPPAELKLELC